MTDAPDQSPVAPARTLSPKWLSMTALAVSFIALALAALPYANGSGDFGGKVRTYLLAHPEVLDEVVQARDARAASDRITATNAAAAANPASLAAGPGEPAFGPRDARVTVVQFFDYRCPYCKTVAPAYVALMRAHPDVRFIFKEWPILDQGANVTSQYAARGALAALARVPERDRYARPEQGRDTRLAITEVKLSGVEKDFVNLAARSVHGLR